MKLDLAAARSTMTAATTFKTFAIAAGAAWPVAQSDPQYKQLVDGFSAARKAVVQDGAKTINEPLPKEKKAAKANFKPKAKKEAGEGIRQTLAVAQQKIDAKRTKAAKAAKAAKPTTKKESAPEVTLTEVEKEAIEAEVRSKTVRPCGCGCEAETRSSFLPGHDAKLRSALIAAAKARKAK